MAIDLSCESDSNERTSARAGPVTLENRCAGHLGNLAWLSAARFRGVGFRVRRGPSTSGGKRRRSPNLGDEKESRQKSEKKFCRQTI